MLARYARRSPVRHPSNHITSTEPGRASKAQDTPKGRAHYRRATANTWKHPHGEKMRSGAQSTGASQYCYAYCAHGVREKGARFVPSLLPVLGHFTRLADGVWFLRSRIWPGLPFKYTRGVPIAAQQYSRDPSGADTLSNDGAR